MPKKPSAPRHSLDSVGDILLPGQSIELLKELHILTRDGRLNQDTRRKLKQVHHLFGFIKPLLQDLEAAQPQGSAGITLADHGAGKSYLGFILYDLFFRERSQGTITASKPARNWSIAQPHWRSGWALRACVFWHSAPKHLPTRLTCPSKWMS